VKAAARGSLLDRDLSSGRPSPGCVFHRRDKFCETRSRLIDLLSQIAIRASKLSSRAIDFHGKNPLRPDQLREFNALQTRWSVLKKELDHHCAKHGCVR
jgi:hypothetical protein